jgi:hypothetical protein
MTETGTDGEARDETAEQSPSGTELCAVRLPESDVYHISRGNGPVCRSDSWGKSIGGSAQTAEIEEAERFFDRCDICEATFHGQLGLTTTEIRAEIRETLGMDSDDGTVFDVDELIRLHRVVVDDDRSVDMEADYDE